MTDELAWEYYRVFLMQHFGWTPAEVDAISQSDFEQIMRALEVQHIRNEAHKKKSKE